MSKQEEEIFAQLERIVSLPTSSSESDNSFCYREKELDPQFHRDDSAFDIITSGLTSPSQVNDDDDTMIKRSYRVMTYISEDVSGSQKMINAHSSLSKEKDNDDLYDGRLLKPSRAGLLAKKIFAAYKLLVKHHSTNSDMEHVCKPHIPHLNKVLSTILAAFPTQVVGASCVGGKDGIEQSLKPMLELHKYVESKHSPILTMAEIIAIGCTGKKKGNMNMQQQQQQQGMMGNPVDLDEVLISNGHRRKFVHGLTQWGGFTNLTNLITKDVSYAYDVGDVLLSTVEFISFPRLQPPSLLQANQNATKVKEEESVGEETLLAMLANEETIQGMLECGVNENAHAKREDIDAVSSLLLQLFELATGKARKKMNPPAVDITEDNGAVECKMAKEDTKPHQAGIDDNKLMKSGVTDKMHMALNSKMRQLVRAMDIHVPLTKESGDAVNDNGVINSIVKHPGHQVEKPFTSNRLQFLTLFADIVSYESHYGPDNKEGNRDLAIKALETIMELPLPPTSEEEVETKDSNDMIICNPWPGIVDLLFDYPENTLYQYQFYRMLHSLCATNHEPSLKLIVQKNKFLSRAIKICKVKTSPASTRGILLRCLNALRLHSQSLPSSSFLRHYLHSHDGWKAFEDDLKQLTLEQQQLGGGIAVPKVVEGESAAVVTLQSDIDIDLGSPFATSLGFPPSVQPYIEKEEINALPAQEINASSPTKKKKKKKKGKKKH